ncbi:MAG: transposase [Rhodanobacteraceae bacterium]|nr:MAG: transposase [Rhodanobacteraceae bacterium]
MLKPTGWWLAVAPADLRCGIDRLLAKVGDELGQDARDGGAYAFRNRSGTRMKVVCMDAQGVWLATRRLHEGTFHWPRAGDAVCTLTPEQFGWLCAGVDWQRLSRAMSSLPSAV